MAIPRKIVFLRVLFFLMLGCVRKRRKCEPTERMGATKTAAGIENVNKFEKVIYSEHRKSFSRFVQNYSASVVGTQNSRTAEFDVCRRISRSSRPSSSAVCFVSFPCFLISYSLFLLVHILCLRAGEQGITISSAYHPFLALTDPLAAPLHSSTKKKKK